MTECSRHPEATPEKKSPSRRFAGFLFALLFLTSLGFQIHSGAWRSDFGGHADEAAHVVTSLMVRDYLGGGFLECWHPMRYAEAYYERFPKVALGHYPPGFYLVASAGLLPFRSGATFLVLMNLLCAGTGILVWSLGRRLLNHDGQAAVVAFLYVILPQSRTYTAIVMADLLLVLLGLLAARFFLCFLRSGSIRDAFLFGLAAAGAILTKGSGIGLALLPLIALLLSGKGKWLISPRLWVAPVPVMLFAFPWMFLTAGITGEGMQESGLLEWARGALPYYGKAVISESGWVSVIALVAAGGFGTFRWIRRKQGVTEVEAVLWALLGCGIVIPLAVPAGLDHRYLMPVMPSILLLGASQIRHFSGKGESALGTVLICLFCLFVFGETWRPVKKLYTGASGSIERILEDSEGKKAGEVSPKVLVVSSVAGEGAVIAAGALLAPDSLTLARGSKELSLSDWMGRGYLVGFETPEELAGILGARGIDYLVTDPPPETTPFEHWRMLGRWLDGEGPLPLRQIGVVPSWRREVESRFSIYRVVD